MVPETQETGVASPTASRTFPHMIPCFSPEERWDLGWRGIVIPEAMMSLLCHPQGSKIKFTLQGPRLTASAFFI